MVELYYHINKYNLLTPSNDISYELENLNVLKECFSKEEVAAQLQKIV